MSSFFVKVHSPELNRAGSGNLTQLRQLNNEMHFGAFTQRALPLRVVHSAVDQTIQQRDWLVSSGHQVTANEKSPQCARARLVVFRSDRIEDLVRHSGQALGHFTVQR